MDLKEYIASIKDFPKEGILFRDVTPLLANGAAFKFAVDKITEFAKKNDAEIIVGPEARGFIIGCPVAYALGIGFVPIRKPNKLPREVIERSYDLEYGSNTLSMHKDAIKKGQKVMVVDDLLATGGTIECAIKMVESLGGIVVGTAFLIELKELNGRKNLSKYPLLSLMEY